MECYKLDNTSCLKLKKLKLKSTKEKQNIKNKHKITMARHLPHKNPQKTTAN